MNPKPGASISSRRKQACTAFPAGFDTLCFKSMLAMDWPGYDEMHQFRKEPARRSLAEDGDHFRAWNTRRWHEPDPVFADLIMLFRSFIAAKSMCDIW